MTVNAKPPDQGAPLWEQLPLGLGPGLLLAGLLWWFWRRHPRKSSTATSPTGAENRGTAPAAVDAAIARGEAASTTPAPDSPAAPRPRPAVS